MVLVSSTLYYLQPDQVLADTAHCPRLGDDLIIINTWILSEYDLGAI